MSASEPLNRRWAVAVAAALLLGLLFVWLAGANQMLFLFVNQLAPQADSFWSWVTLLGDTLVLFVLLLPFAGRYPDVVRAVFLAAVLVSLAVHGLKPLLAHPRPPAVFDASQLHTIGYIATSGSFPSGHTAAAFTLAGVLCMVSLPRQLKWVAFVLAIMVGMSRMAVGIHWPIDVFAGALTGWLAAAISVALVGIGGFARGIVAQRIFAVLLLCAALMLPFSGDLGYPLGRPLLLALPFVIIAVAFPGLRRLYAGRIE